MGRLSRLSAAGTPWAQVPEVERVVYAVNTLVFDVNNVLRVALSPFLQRDQLRR